MTTVRVLIVDADSEAATRRAAEIANSPMAFAVSVRLAEHKLAERAASPGVALEGSRCTTLQTWRIIAIDDTMCVSGRPPIYRIEIATGGALLGFRRMFQEMTATAERFL